MNCCGDTFGSNTSLHEGKLIPLYILDVLEKVVYVDNGGRGRNLGAVDS